MIMAKLKFYVAILLVFALGMFSGALVVAQLAKSNVRGLATSSTEELSQRVLAFLDEDLDLSDEQLESISQIMTAAVDEIDPIRARMRSNALQILQKYHRLISDELNSEQREDFDKTIEQIESRIQAAEGQQTVNAVSR
jgi:hypothetical protein